jgi:hypothetical protein
VERRGEGPRERKEVLDETGEEYASSEDMYESVA